MSTQARSDVMTVEEFLTHVGRIAFHSVKGKGRLRIARTDYQDYCRLHQATSWERVVWLATGATVTLPAVVLAARERDQGLGPVSVPELDE